MSLLQFDGKLIDGLQFCAKAYSLFEEIRNQPNGISNLRMRTTNVEKKLLEEILPISRYIQTKYRTGRYISVCWIQGNQQFDAEVFEQGGYIDAGCYPAKSFLEVICAMHPNEYLSWELLEKKGGAFGLDGIRRLKKSKDIESEPVVYTNGEFVEFFSQLIIEQINKKVSIKYPENTTLIVSCSLNNLYTPDEWLLLQEMVISAEIEHNFREIFVYDTTTEYNFSLWSRR
ncbi:MAG: hypothetical protein Q7U16_12085 [Agitococcus sp.]|nr:hypothetical protein [Agitococcus sp.]